MYYDDKTTSSSIKKEIDNAYKLVPLTRNEKAILKALVDDDTLTIEKLAKITETEKEEVGRIFTSLERDGYIYVSNRTTSNRKVFIDRGKFTNNGVAFIRRIEEESEDHSHFDAIELSLLSLQELEPNVPVLDHMRPKKWVKEHLNNNRLPNPLVNTNGKTKLRILRNQEPLDISDYPNIVKCFQESFNAYVTIYDKFKKLQPEDRGKDWFNSALTIKAWHRVIQTVERNIFDGPDTYYWKDFSGLKFSAERFIDPNHILPHYPYNYYCRLNAILNGEEQFTHFPDFYHFLAVSITQDQLTKKHRSEFDTMAARGYDNLLRLIGGTDHLDDIELRATFLILWSLLKFYW